MGNSKRRSTVHDFATLRLHPDGSRVALSQTNNKSRTSNYTTQDHRGNWIARDAGGLGRVKTRRAAAKTREEGEDQLDEDEENAQGAGPSTLSSDKGKGRALDDDEDEERVLKDSRAKKRKLFHEDIGVHASGSSHDVGRSQPTVSTHKNTPSQPTSIPKPTSVSRPSLSHDLDPNERRICSNASTISQARTIVKWDSYGTRLGNTVKRRNYDASQD